MAAALVLHGAIDEQMFADVNGEHMMVYAKLRPFLGELRARLNNPTYLDKIEQVILRLPDAEARLARSGARAIRETGLTRSPEGRVTAAVIPRPAAAEYDPYYGRYIDRSPRATCCARSRTRPARRSGCSPACPNPRHCTATPREMGIKEVIDT